MTRKKIAVYLASIDKQYQQTMCQGLDKASRDYDVDICIFNCQGFTEKNMPVDERGEAAIYELPDPEQFDGIITLYATQANQAAQDQILDILDAYPEKPHVSIDVPLENAVMVSFDDAVSVRELTEHLILEHNRKKFAFIEGPVHHPVSQKRLDACREVLNKYGMELPDSMVRSGEWTYDGGVKAAKEILANGKPDVIMCANDYMAFGALEVVTADGTDKLDETIITGFDAIQEASFMGMPTILRPVDKAADLAVSILTRWINGEVPTEKTVLLPTEIVYGSFCSKYKGSGSTLDRLRGLLNEFVYVQDVLADAGVSSRGLAGVGEEEEAREKIAEFAETWNMQDLHVCVDPGVFQMSEHSKHSRTYPDQMMVLAGILNGERLAKGIFNTAQLIPYLAREDREAVCMVFCPIHYRDMNFGYVAMRYNVSTGISLYPALMLITGALISLYLQANLRKTAALVEHMALHDTMTGMLNRRGYEKYASDAFREAKEKGLCFAMASIDMDYMKFINDRYGHQAGDEAICRLGRALSKLEEKNFTCVHISGDEFIVYGICRDTATAHRIISHTVERELSNMNQRDPWLCDISVSMGIYAAVPQGIDMLDGYLTQADRNMYEIKHAKHKAETRK